MEVEKLKNLPVKERIHGQIVLAAKTRGMTIQGLTERILRTWLTKNFFVEKVASSNIKVN